MKRKSPEKTAIEPDRSMRCHTCSRAIAGFESVHYGSIEAGYRDLCNRCFNLEVAAAGAIDFAHVQFEPLEMLDAAGETHRFHFEVHLLGDRVSLEAFELVNGAPGGFQFQVLGNAEEDLFKLMGQLVPRIRRLLAQQHLKTEPHMPGLHIADLLVRGRITWDENEDGRLPMLVIDEHRPGVDPRYDPSWPDVFSKLSARVKAALGSLAVDVEHIGSTAVPGLAAKPIIDVDVVLASRADLPEAIRLLAAIGYAHEGDLGIAGREAFRSPPGSPRHHLYVLTPRSKEVRRHLTFRDSRRQRLKRQVCGAQAITRESVPGRSSRLHQS